MEHLDEARYAALLHDLDFGVCRDREVAERDSRELLHLLVARAQQRDEPDPSSASVLVLWYEHTSAYVSIRAEEHDEPEGVVCVSICTFVQVKQVK